MTTTPTLHTGDTVQHLRDKWIATVVATASYGVPVHRTTPTGYIREPRQPDELRVLSAEETEQAEVAR